MAAIFTLDVQGLEELRRKAGTMAPVVYGALNRGLRDIASVMVPALKRNTPRKTGILADSTEAQVTGHDMDQRLEVRQTARTNEGSYYWRFPALGTRPHVIEPRYAQSLRFVVGGQVVYARRVNHPGNRASNYHTKTLEANLPTIRSIMFQQQFRAAMRLKRGNQ